MFGANCYFSRNCPITPECDRTLQRELHRNYLLQMTNPDHWHNCNHSHSQTPTPDEGFSQPIFFSAINVDDVVHARPEVVPLAAHGAGSGGVPAGPSIIHAPEVGPVAAHGVYVPEVVLPPGWDAPLRNPIPVNIPPACYGVDRMEEPSG